MLTEKQKRFCEEYLIDLNATQSAIRAGYSKKTASRIAVELLNKTQVSAYLKVLRENQSQRTEISSDAIVNELKDIAFTETEITEKGKMKALELLGKHLGMFEGKAINNEGEKEISKLFDTLKKE